MSPGDSSRLFVPSRPPQSGMSVLKACNCMVSFSVIHVSPQVQETENSYEDGGQWFYEGRGGWWQYDQRTSVEIEAAMAREEERCELLIAGSLYIIDFEHMLQYRRNDPSRRRRIKRDQASGPKKGVAGLRLDVVEEPQEEDDPDADHDAGDAEADDAEDPAVQLVAALDGLSVEPRDGQVAEDQGSDPDQP